AACTSPTLPGSETAGSQAGRAARSSSVGCILTPEQTEGPYYMNNGLIRSDITEGKPGVPLQLNLAVVSADGCAPISNATAEVWHCDASGVYSGFSSGQVQGAAETAAGGGRLQGGPPAGGPGGG